MKIERKPLSIVMVEDNLELCEGWSELFNLLGYEISCYQHALQALSDIDKLQEADLIFSDYYLPDMNGVEFIKTLRARLPHIPAVIVTGSRETFIEESVSGLQNADIVYKPLNIEDIEAQIERFTRVH